MGTAPPLPAKISPVPAFPGRLKKRVRTPTLIQIEAVECGAVVLGIILRHYGRYVPVEELRTACDVSRSGSSAIKVLKAARQYGLEAAGWKQELSDLVNLPLPFAVYWNFSHFLIVEEFERHAVYLNDPATGPRKVTIEEFDVSFTGVAMTFKPGPNFKRGGEPPRLIRSLLNRLPLRSIFPVAFLFLTGIGLAVGGLITPTFQQVFVNDYLIQGMDSWVKPLLWMMLVTAVITAVLQWLQSYILIRFSLQLAVSMEGHFFWHVLRLPMSFFAQRFAGEIAKRTTINDQVATLLTGNLASTLVSLLTILPYALLLFTYNWILALIGLSIATINLLSLRLIGRVRTDSNSQLLQDQGILNGTIIAGLQNIESIKATASEDDLFARLAGCQAKVVSGNQRLGALSQTLRQAPSFLNQLNTVAMLTIGGFAIMNGNFSVGSFLAFQSLMGIFMGPFTKLAGLGGQLQVAQGSMYRLDDVLHAQIDPLVRNTPKETLAMEQAPFRGALELRNVTFGYSPQGPPLLQNVSLKVDPGQRIAIVGSTGSGKSCLVMLIAGLLEPWSGEILFDGKPRSAWPRQQLARAVGYVGQRIYLFEGSIQENLSLFDPSISMKDIEQAARDAQIHDAIMSKSGGYSAGVCEEGRNFSGGQCQRLEIARALAQNPSLIILDEATSSLDPRTELAVDESFRRRRMTAIIAAHRLSTIRDSQEIIVLRRGQIVERGIHDDLIKGQGYYADLVRS
jgi:NHLM bacteriocin system ABC transporter peptidase/ATP-binding protein